MRSSHSLDRVGAAFDGTQLVADAGLLLPATLADHLGLKGLVLPATLFGVVPAGLRGDVTAALGGDAAVTC